MRQRLYLKLYLALIVAVLASLSAATMVLLLVWTPPKPHQGPPRARLGRLEAKVRGLSGGELQRAIEEFADENGADVVVWGPDRKVLAYTGDEPARKYPDLSRAPPRTQGSPVGEPETISQRPAGADAGGSRPPALPPESMRSLPFKQLKDGRMAAIVMRDPYGFLDLILPANGLLFLLLAIACFPIARLVTRRLEALKKGVEKWSQGELSIRLPVEGEDEIASVADEFNMAAERIEKLLVQQRQMLASASHELRSPLTRIRMALELLRGEEGRDEFRDRACDGAAKDIDELDGLIGDLLLAARAESTAQNTPRVPVSLLPVLRNEADRFNLAVTGDHASVLGDRLMLRRMFRNLLENAGKYAGTEGTEVAVRRADDQVVIEVRDRGPGIPDHEKERIFEPFYRPANHREGRDGGVGLGLVLVRQIAAFHGGTATCVDRPGGGTTFVVELPTTVANPP